MEETKTDYVLMKETEQNKRALLREDKCDKYDYLAAVACGAVGGPLPCLRSHSLP